MCWTNGRNEILFNALEVEVLDACSCCIKSITCWARSDYILMEMMYFTFCAEDCVIYLEVDFVHQATTSNTFICLHVAGKGNRGESKPDQNVEWKHAWFNFFPFENQSREVYLDEVKKQPYLASWFSNGKKKN